MDKDTSTCWLQGIEPTTYLLKDDRTPSQPQSPRDNRTITAEKGENKLINWVKGMGLGTYFPNRCDGHRFEPSTCEKGTRRRRITGGLLQKFSNSRASKLGLKARKKAHMHEVRKKVVLVEALGRSSDTCRANSQVFHSDAMQIQSEGRGNLQNKMRFIPLRNVGSRRNVFPRGCTHTHVKILLRSDQKWIDFSCSKIIVDRNRSTLRD